jgi:phosphoglycerate dehydrogenase-like enzyme
MAAGEWRKRDESSNSSPLRNRKVGLLGYGAVNQKVHKLLSGFDLEFSILRRDWGDSSIQLPTNTRKFLPHQLLQFLKEVDILVLAIPLTGLTQSLIRREELELLGPDGLLVNVARGKVVEEEDLYKALKEGVIAGAAIDVWYNYHPIPDSEGHQYPFAFPFHELQNVVLSPHRAASPLNDLERWDEVIENIERVAEGDRQFINLVDLGREY